MNIIWHATASIEIKNSIGSILFDPFIPISGTEIEISIEEFDNFTDIFVTHAHLDHIISIPKIIKRNPNTIVHCTNAPYTALKKLGVPVKNLDKLSYEQQINKNGFNIKIRRGLHAVLPKASIKLLCKLIFTKYYKNIPFLINANRVCKEKDDTVFYEIECENKNIVLFGSMNLRDGVDYPINPDLLILPYNGWTDNFPPAVQVIEKIQPKLVLLDHYDNTFPPLTKVLDMSKIIKKYEHIVQKMEHHKVYTI